MKHWKNTILSAALLAVLTATPAHALEYTMEAPDDYLFGRPTSDDTIYEWEDPNVDRSKNVALIPPAFGSPTSYLPGSGTPLTPSLIPGALSGGGLVNSAGSVSYPAIGLSTKVYQGTDSAVLRKGVGHFKNTSLWDGNCCLAAHNRGTRDDFKDLHTLEPGDTITWTTKLGTRTYEVISVTKVRETDTSGTAATSDNRLTLYTCVRDQRDYRWMVQAIER